MSQLAASEGQPGNWEEPGFFLRRLAAVKSQEEGWQEPCESRGSRTDLWERGGEIPLRYPTQRFSDIWFLDMMSQTATIKIDKPLTHLFK
jgi:hypothetical protein